MKSKTLALGVLSVFVFAAFIGMASAVTLAEWDLTADDGIATNVNTNTNDGVFTSSGVTFNSFDAVNGADADDWPTADSLDSLKYFEVTIAPNTNFDLSISNISFDYSGSALGPSSFELQYSTQSNFASPTTLTTEVDVSNEAVETSSNSGLSISVDSGETLTLRWFGYNFDAITNDFFVKTLLIQGTSTAVSEGFCSAGEVNATELELSVDISNKGEGDDERWLPLDVIEIEVELDNRNDRIDFDNDGDADDGDGDLDDVKFELGLFEEGALTVNLIDDMEWISNDDEEFEVGNIDEDESDKHTFKFRVDPGEIDDGNYVLMVKAYPKGGETDEACIDSSSDLGDNDFGSSEFFADIEVELEDDTDKMVVVDVVDDEADLILLNAFCGSQTSVSLDVWNIGDEDFEDRVLVTLKNLELGLDEEVVIDGDFDAGDKETVIFNFAVPQDAEKKIHTLKLRTLYDYDEDDEDYDEESDETFHVFLRVDGNCQSFTGSEASVTANLESGGDAGDNLVIKTTITNTGDEQMTYLVSPAGFGVWASSADAVPATFTLAAGQSRDVTLTLSVNDDASGQQSFNVEVISNNELVVSQPVSVEIEGKSGFLTGSAIGSNGYLWGFGLLNLIIIVAIIIVAVRVMRR
jgi:hypothetical protein